MLTHESSLGVIEDDKLDWLIDPSVAKAKLNALVSLGDPTMPQTTGELNDVRGCFCVKADYERRRMNGVGDVGVMGVRTEVLVVLRGKKNSAKRWQ